MILQYAQVITANFDGSYQVQLNVSQQMMITDSLVTSRLVHTTTVYGYLPGDKVMVVLFGRDAPGQRPCIIGLVAQTTPLVGTGITTFTGTAHATHTP
jgi:hypothetical protein